MEFVVLLLLSSVLYYISYRLAWLGKRNVIYSHRQSRYLFLVVLALVLKFWAWDTTKLKQQF